MFKGRLFGGSKTGEDAPVGNDAHVVVPRACPAIERLHLEGITGALDFGADTELSRLEAAAKAHVPTHDWGPEYDVIKAAFDPAFYFAQNADIRQGRLDPVAHYIRAGARENRDPVPWFSTGEYRRAYLAQDKGGHINPFFHYLSVGQARGHAPRAPSNFGIFCDSLGRSPDEVCALSRARMDDVHARLRNGTLGDMVRKATALDPLVAEAWPAAMRVRVPPATNTLGVGRIGHLIDLQQQAQERRAKAVVVVQGDAVTLHQKAFRRLVAGLDAQVGSEEVVVVVIRGAVSRAGLNPASRIVHFATAQPAGKDYVAGRTLVEFIRSLRPEVVVNFEAQLMTRATRSLGRALAAARPVYQYLPFDPTSEAAKASFGSRYYRALEQHQRVLVPSAAARDYLTATFCLTPEQRGAIWVVDDMVCDADERAA